MDRLRDAIRSGAFAKEEQQAPQGVLTFKQLAEVYVDRYVNANALASADTIEYRLPFLIEHFGTKPLVEIKAAEIEDLIAKLNEPAFLSKHHQTQRTRRPATINRYRSLLRHMFNWAESHRYLSQSPVVSGRSQSLKPQFEDNQRHRRVSVEEEKQLLDAAPEHLRPLIVIALDAGLRRGEMLALTWADVDARPGWLRLRGETTKSGKTRWVPVSTARLKAVLDFLRLDVAGQQKAPEAKVCANEVDEAIKAFRTGWIATVVRAHGGKPQWQKRSPHRRFTDESLEEYRKVGLRWHDLRHEYASRLVERGVPLSQVRDLLGHASITTTERYDNQKPETLMEAAKRLETGECFKFVSSSDAKPPTTKPETTDANDDKLLKELEKEVGVGNGVRTRDFRSHSPALYR